MSPRSRDVQRRSLCPPPTMPGLWISSRSLDADDQCGENLHMGLACRMLRFVPSMPALSGDPPDRVAQSLILPGRARSSIARVPAGE